MSLIDKITFRLNFYLGNMQNYFYGIYLRHKLKSTKFSIICNNCYAGHLYEVLNRPYNTPTVGLYFFAEDYIKFISNLTEYLKEDLNFIEKSRFKESHVEHEKLKYPIGLLSNNLEIHFLHYKTPEEALAKWNRRKSRLDKNNLMIMMNDQNAFSGHLMSDFDSVPYPKIFFSSKDRTGENVKVISYYKGKPHVGDMYRDRIKVLNDFDISKWILNNIS